MSLRHSLSGLCMNWWCIFLLKPPLSLSFFLTTYQRKIPSEMEIASSYKLLYAYTYYTFVTAVWLWGLTIWDNYLAKCCVVFIFHYPFENVKLLSKFWLDSQFSPKMEIDGSGRVVHSHSACQWCSNNNYII